MWAAIGVVVLVPQLATTLGGNETMMVQTIAGLAGWLGWVTTLLLTEWWLERGDTATRRASGAVWGGERRPMSSAQPSR